MIKREFKRYKKYHKEKIEDLTTFGKLLFNRPIIKFVYLTLAYIILNTISGYFKEQLLTRLVINTIEILIAVYFIAVMFFLIKRWYNRLLNPKNMLSLILTYALFIFAIILMFSTILSIVEISQAGYIKYGECSGNYDPNMALTDKGISREFFYFTAITFFSVGYGDICPMGFAKIISMLIAFTGHLVSVILVALIINNYLRTRT